MNAAEKGPPPVTGRPPGLIIRRYIKGSSTAQPPGHPNRAVSPARKKQVKFAEAQQTFPVVAESYGWTRIAALESEGDATDVQDCADLLDGVDLKTLDEATVAALYEELQEPDLTNGELDFPDRQ